MNRSLFLAILVILATVSCTNYSNVDVKYVKLNSFKLVSTSKASIEFDYTVDNPTGSSIVISTADGIITKKGVDFAQLELMKSDTIPPRTLKSGKINIDITLLDPISLLSMGLNIASWRVEDFNVNAKVVIKTSSSHRKTLRFKNVPLGNLTGRL